MDAHEIQVKSDELAVSSALLQDTVAKMNEMRVALSKIPMNDDTSLDLSGQRQRPDIARVDQENQ